MGSALDNSPAPPGSAPGSAVTDLRFEDLAEVIRAYSSATEKLQHSHERLKGEVLRLRRELASTNAQLQRSKRLSALGEMAAGIAHEIRNPLAAIQLYVEMVVADLGEAQPRATPARENAVKIAAAVRGLNAIVVDVLSFAREVEPRRAALTVSEVLDRAVEAHRPAIEAMGVAVVRRDREQPGLRVHADPSLLHQALLNLIRNAVDAMADASQRTLTLDAASEEQGVSLIVRDTGPGIVQEDVDRIFNPFFTTRNSGTGLGLAIVHRIVDAHDGAILVHNNPATGGAVFELSLPAVGEKAGVQESGSSA